MIGVKSWMMLESKEDSSGGKVVLGRLKRKISKLKGRRECLD